MKIYLKEVKALARPLRDFHIEAIPRESNHEAHALRKYTWQAMPCRLKSENDSICLHKTLDASTCVFFAMVKSLIEPRLGVLWFGYEPKPGPQG